MPSFEGSEAGFEEFEFKFAEDGSETATTNSKKNMSRITPVPERVNVYTSFLLTVDALAGVQSSATGRRTNVGLALERWAATAGSNTGLFCKSQLGAQETMIKGL